MQELPDYELRRHARTRRLRLSVNSIGKVTVSAPKRISQKVIQQFVIDNLDWINTTIQRQQDSRMVHPDLGMHLPQKISLKSIKKTVEVSVNLSDRHYVTEIGNFLYLYGSEQSKQIGCLKDWIKETAREFLNKQLAMHAENMNLSYNKVYIKNQKSRWGSCSTRKNINLNQNLIFFNVELVDYLLVHELSHLVHQNHSSRFWRHVEKFDPDYKEHDRALIKAAKTIPLWALPLE